MLAAVWHGRRDIRVEEFPDPPSPGKKEVKIRVEWAGICGTDLEEYCFGPLYIPVDRPNPITGRKAPMILGHEFVGTVIEKGSAVTEFKIGDRVTPDTALFCGECYYCKRNLVHFCDKLALLGLMTDGGFAQYVNAPTYMCYKLPANVAPELGALAEPTAVAIRAVRIGGIKIGDRVAVLGAGIIGLLCQQAAELAGAKEIYVIDREKNRLAVAKAQGATAIINPDKTDVVKAVKDLTDGLGADVVLEAGGNAITMALAPQLCRKGGCAVILGLHNEPVPINLFPVVCGEIAIKGSFSHVYNEDYADAVAYLGAGRFHVDKLISARINLNDMVEKGINELLNNKSKHLKILVSPQNEA
jgi:(R,R)-butanediol dehydrogenase/meso-butanediol dehydrogenase/diacetyl reductase